MECKDYELTSEELVKQLKACARAEYVCSTCPFENEEGCSSQLMLNAASKIESQDYVIKGMRKNIAKLNAQNDKYMQAIASLRQESREQK